MDQTGARLFVRAASGKSNAGPCPVTPPVDGSCSSVMLDAPGDGADAATSSGASCSAAAATADAAHAARINMPVVPNSPVAEGPQPLSMQRQASSIPIAAEASALPAHQRTGDGAGAEARPVWMYPSEQQFYNAMQRKGWSPAPHDMPAVVAIHNMVNERAWAQVLMWEALHSSECPDGPRLKRFQGKPEQYSPKARLLNLLGYKLPFDRHDWVVDRCGREVRYVIDFYSGAPQPGAQASVHLDVRPALDSVEAVLDRLRVQLGWAASGSWLRPA